MHSNHSPNILRQSPKSIEKIISKTSSDKDIFDKSTKSYKSVLKESGFKDRLNYIPPETNTGQSKRKKNLKIIWFNYTRSVKTNTGKTFLCLLSKHFPPKYSMHKTFNRNMEKISYSCLRNIIPTTAAFCPQSSNTLDEFAG